MFQTIVAEKIKTHFMFSNLFSPEIRTVYKIMRKNVGNSRQATDVSIIRRMRTACWIPKAADTHSEYVILFAFPRQKWLHERATILLYTNIVCRVVTFCSPACSHLHCVCILLGWQAFLSSFSPRIWILGKIMYSIYTLVTRHSPHAYSFWG